MAEVVQAGEEAEDERNGDVEDDEDQVADGLWALWPGVEQVEERERYDAEN